MKLHFVDTNDVMIECLKNRFGEQAQYTLGKFEDVKKYDAVVSPGNSFGIMDGGFDLALRDFFGQKLQDDVQRAIRSKHFGEQPVGTALIVPTGKKKHPWLVHAPTMSLPQIIATTHNVYFAMLAVLHACERHNHRASLKPDGFKAIKTLLCPGLGTSTGKMLPAAAALQMSLAWNNFAWIKKSPKRSWDDFKPPAAEEKKESANGSV